MKIKLFCFALGFVLPTTRMVASQDQNDLDFLTQKVEIFDSLEREMSNLFDSFNPNHLKSLQRDALKDISNSRETITDMLTNCLDFIKLDLQTNQKNDEYKKEELKVINILLKYPIRDHLASIKWDTTFLNRIEIVTKFAFLETQYHCLYNELKVKIKKRSNQIPEKK